MEFSEGEPGPRRVTKRRIHICRCCEDFTADNLRAVRAHWGRSKECKRIFQEHAHEWDDFWSTVEVRMGPQDHQAGGQAMRQAVGQRSRSHQDMLEMDFHMPEAAGALFLE